MRFVLLIFLLFSFNIHAQESIKFIDQNYILNNSFTGKNILSDIKKIYEKETKIFEKKKKNLESKKKSVLSKKNILDENEFKKTIDELNIEINLFEKEKKIFIQELQKKQNVAQSKYLESINKILAEYSKNNSISLILKKDNIVIARSELDITEEILKILDNKKIDIGVN